MDEVWKDIKAYEGLYQVSNLGRVRCLKGKSERILKQRKDRNGYIKIHLSKHGKRKYTTLHRLIAQAFIPNPENKPQVNHIDGTKHNNCLDNLEWVTQKENMQHAEINNLIPTHGREYSIRVCDLTTGEELYFINTRSESKYFNKSKTYFSNIPCFENRTGRHLDCDYIVEKVEFNLNEYYII